MIKWTSYFCWPGTTPPRIFFNSVTLSLHDSLYLFKSSKTSVSLRSDSVKRLKSSHIPEQAWKRNDKSRIKLSVFSYFMPDGEIFLPTNAGSSFKSATLVVVTSSSKDWKEKKRIHFVNFNRYGSYTNFMNHVHITELLTSGHNVSYCTSSIAGMDKSLLSYRFER